MILNFPRTLIFPRKTVDGEGLLFERLFRGCVKQNRQVKVYKNEEEQMGFLSLEDVIKSEDIQEKVIASYFKEVKIKEA